MEKRNLYVLVAVILVAGLVLSFSNLTGRSMSVLGDCEETDGGDDPYSPGITAYSEGPKEYKDECYSRTGAGVEKWLSEKYCQNKISTRRYFCEGGCLKDINGVGYCAEGEADLVSDD